MRPGAFLFSGEWVPAVKALPETGQGYPVVSVELRDGRHFNQAIVDSGYLSRIRALPNVPFVEADISGIKANHEKWDWTENP